MLQIILLVMGISALIRGELKVTKTRVVPAGRGRALGASALATAIVPMLMDDRSPAPFFVMLGGIVVLVTAGFALAEPRGQSPTAPPPIEPR